jgi:membrane protease YdiL (CAAX protease family)
MILVFMGITSAVLHVVVVSGISVLLSLLALVAIQHSGVDLKDFRQRTHPRILLIAAGFNLLFIVAVAILMKLWDDQHLSLLGFSLDNPDLVFVLGGLLLSLLLGTGFVWLLHSIRRISIAWNPSVGENTVASGRWWLALVVLLVAALQEEILFRGYLAYILKPYGFLAALLVSTLLFAAWHFLTNKVTLFQTIDWLLGGMMLFFVYWLSGSVWVATLIHFSRNLTNVVVFDIGGTGAVVKYHQLVSPAQKTVYTIAHSLVSLLLALLWYGMA